MSTTSANRQLTQAFERDYIDDVEQLYEIADGYDSSELECFDRGEPLTDDPYPRYLGQGSFVAAFELQEGVVAKLPVIREETRNTEKSRIVRQAVASLLIGKGYPGLEQILAASTKKPYAILTKLALEEEVSCLFDSVRADIPDDHFRNLVESLSTMQNLQLRTDSGNPNNLIYGPHGFTVIDYTQERIYRTQCQGVEYSPQSLSDKVSGFARTSILIPKGTFHLPDYAMRYHNVCSEMLGPQASWEIQKTWSNAGILVPEALGA